MKRDPQPSGDAQGLAGRVALITGASRGIGAAVARRLAAQGCDLVLHHHPNPDMAQLTSALGTELRSLGVRATEVGADLSHKEDVDRLCAATRRFGRVNILVANAAYMPKGEFETFADEEWQLAWDVNVMSTVRICKALRPDLHSNHGRIVLISSVMAGLGLPGAAPYVATKAALVGLTRSLAREFGDDYICVNCVMPGSIRTEHEIEQTTPTDERRIAEIAASRQAIKRRGAAQDLAGVCAFLASDDASFITGQTISVDGGWHFR